MTMFTRHVSRQLAAHLDGRLAQPMAQHVELHLRECPRCQADCEQVRQGMAIMEQLPAPDGGGRGRAPRMRLWQVRAKEVVLATGALVERIVDEAPARVAGVSIRSAPATHPLMIVTALSKRVPPSPPITTRRGFRA